MVQPTRPKGCPLFLHRNGQWSKKVKGKPRYFGTDLGAALKRWADEKDRLLAGYEPQRTDGRPTIAELANLYLADSRRRVQSGEVRGDHTTVIESVIGLLVSSVGKNAKPDMMAPHHWIAARQAMATSQTGKPLAVTTLKVRVSRCRAFLNWCQKQKYVKSIDTGDAFTPPAKRLLRLAKNSRGKQLWSATNLRALITAAPIEFNAVIFLAINAAMGSSDIADLRRSQWKSGQEYLDCPRHKTGILRRVWLWPETREAMALAVAKRATPAKQAYENRLLLSPRGYPWARVERGASLDLAKAALARLKVEIKVTNGALYDCRRTFRTVASEVCDLEAINHCMGHEGAGEGKTYLQGVSDERIKKVCQHVRSWLFDGVSK